MSSNSKLPVKMWTLRSFHASNANTGHYVFLSCAHDDGQTGGEVLPCNAGVIVAAEI